MICIYMENHTSILFLQRFLKPWGYFTKLHFSCLVNLFLHYITNLIYPYLTYCNLIQASTYVTNLQLIYLSQKRTVRTISKADYRASSKPLFTNLNVLDISSIYSLQVCSFMYSYHNGLLLPSFVHIFQTRCQTQHYSSSYFDFYRPWSCRTNIKKNDPCFFKALKFGTLYRPTLKPFQLLVHLSFTSKHS